MNRIFWEYLEELLAEEAAWYEWNCPSDIDGMDSRPFTLII